MRVNVSVCERPRFVRMHAKRSRFSAINLVDFSQISIHENRPEFILNSCT